MQMRTPSRTIGTRLTLAAAAVLLLAFVAVTAWVTNDAQAQGSVPGKPARPTADSVSHESVTFSWTDPGDSSITGYQILRRNRDADAKGNFTVIENNTGGAGTSYTDDTIEASTRYGYRVKARNADGISTQSDALRVSTPAEPAPTPSPTPTQVPTPAPTPNGDTRDSDVADDQQQDRQGRSHTDQPQNFRATGVSYESVTLEWNEAPSNITHYKIERTGGSYGTEEFGGGILPNTSLEQMEPDTSYTFTLKFGTSSTHSGPGSTITVRTLAIPAPTNLRLQRIYTNETKAEARFLWDNPTQTTGLQYASARYDANRENEADLVTHTTTRLYSVLIDLDTETVYQFATWYRTEDQNGNFHDGPKAYVQFTTPKLPEISISDASTEEGDHLVFRVEITAFANRISVSNIRVELYFSGNTAEASDFAYYIRTIPLQSNDTSTLIVFPTIEDAVYEGTETVTATLTSLDGHVTIAQGTATGTIIDDEPLPLVSFAETAVSFAEDAGINDVCLEADPVAEAPMNFIAGINSNSQADLSDDFAVLDSRIYFEARQNASCLPVEIYEDDIYEGDETFSFFIHAQPDLFRTDQATDTLIVTIIDNDPTPRLAVTALTGTEGGQNQSSIPVPGQEFGNVVFQLDLDRPAGVPITIHVDSVNGTAVVGDDYHNVPGAWIIPEGETSVRYKIPVTDDNLFEGGRHEYFEIVLSNPDPPIFTGEIRTTAYIKDNDAPPAGVDYVDDTTDTTGVIEIGESWLNDNPVNGRIEKDYDYDWYRTELQGEHCYQIEVRGQGNTDSGDATGLTLPDPVLRGVYTKYGNYMEGTQNDDGGSHLAALKTIKIDATSVVYISVMSGQPEERGTFDLSLIDLGTAPETCTDINPSVTDAWASTETDAPKTVSEPVGEDLPTDASTIGYVQPNGKPATGNLPSSEGDWFKVPLVAGFRYTIEMKGNEASDYGGTLDNPGIAILDESNRRLKNSRTKVWVPALNEGDFIEDNESGAGNNAKLRLVIRETDTYLITAGSIQGTTGTYTLVVTRR